MKQKKEGEGMISAQLDDEISESAIVAQST